MIDNLFYSGLASILIGAVLPLLLVKLNRIPKFFGLTATIIGNALLLISSGILVYSGNSISMSIMEIAPKIKLELLVDKLAAFFIATISVVSIATAVYTFGYIEHYSSKIRKNLSIFLMNLFLLSMVLVVISKNTYSFLMFWELMSFSSFFLVYLEYDKKETRKAGIFYLIMTQISTVFLIASFFMIYNANGSFDISPLQPIPPYLLTILFLCVFVGFGIKAGMIPFHKWLPYAHPTAPSNISALMSGLMINVAAYGLVRFILFVLPIKHIWWGVVILIAGTASAILGVIYALKEYEIKRLLAYSTIENMGIILIGIGLYIIFQVSSLPQIAIMALAGSLFHTLNHAVFKSLLFLTAGSIVNATHTKNFEIMGGLIKRMPYTAVLFLIGAVSISALPPFNGFVSELMIFQTFFNFYLISSPFVQILLFICACILALTSALTAACFVKAFGIIFLGVPRSEEAKNAKEASSSMLIGPMLLAIMCAALGIFSFQIFNILNYPLSIPNLMVTGGVLAIAYITGIILFFRMDKNKRAAETWGCGFPLSNGKTEYSASGFSQPIVNIFDVIYRPKANIDKQYFDGAGVNFRKGHVELSLMKFFEEYIYIPTAKSIDFVSKLISKLQTGYLDIYLIYVFFACLSLVIITGFLV